ncbi:MAG: peptidylprolyl isomerase, partial [Bacteroidales bacterium]|nr:peptidylprolyl isomerase [Bacteroidales bacterium]
QGEDFSEVALEYSDDVRTDRRGNKIRTGREGLMGYFTTTQVYYLLEEALYSMKVGEISQPIRTKYGYHVVQLLDKKPTLGKVTISHILVPVYSPDSAAEARAKARIDSAYDMLESGYDFGEVAMKYSADQQSAVRGGKMGTMNVNRISAEEAEQLYKLREGEYSKPFRGRYGWQIVQLDAKTGMPNDMDALALVRYNIETGLDRGHLPYIAFVEKKLKTSHWTWDEKVIKEMQEYLRKLGSLRKVPRHMPENEPLFTKTVLRFEDLNFSVWDFLNVITKETPSDDKVNNQKNWFNAMKTEAVRAAAIRHEYNILEQKYPEYAKQVREYRDGVYLFEVSNRKVWSKALTDTAGLLEYFETHRDKYICPTKVKAKVMMYDVSMVDTRDVAKLAQKAFDNKMDQREIQMMFDKKYKGNRLVKVDSSSYAHGDNIFVDNTPWTVGLSRDILTGTSRKDFVIIDEVLPPRPYELAEFLFYGADAPR